MTTKDFIQAASEVLSDCPLNDCFQWTEERDQSLGIVSQKWKNEACAEIALDSFRRLFERSLFAHLRNGLVQGAVLGDDKNWFVSGTKIIAGRDCLFTHKVLDPFPLRGDSVKEPINPMLKTDDGKTVFNPVWQNARQEFRLRAQTFPFDEQDLFGVKITAEIKDNCAFVRINIPKHVPGVVQYWAVMRERRGLV